LVVATGAVEAAVAVEDSVVLVAAVLVAVAQAVAGKMLSSFYF
jgi:hypothetical protein